MKVERKKPAKKKPNDYPRITFRVDANTLSRLSAVSQNGGISVGQLVSNAVRCKLPDFERLHSKLVKAA